jgi:RNA polymerase sigma-70 factor, ECF subfamily
MPPEEPDDPVDVTGLLERWQAGDGEAFDRASTVVYPELQRIARAYLGRERNDHTLQPTALVNEAFVRLSQAGRLRFDGRTQFFALAAQLMRRILVDHARSIRAGKRGGGASKVPFDGAIHYAADAAADFITLHDALDDLARLSARKARIIELRFFGGLSLDETAQMLGISKTTAHREQRLAQAWLTEQLSQIPRRA